ncbi:uncharacterized protein F5Z01DRAFT_651402 [Emericellopsis atlantica]|uniref:Uncharacterized protein n=1 Tax=Emericellopsis atlantica TaxID=2614577 RepID=A0A9P7ZPW1_9HYPO|nr:uncharacterized protein F5Z01DRAFT_651402 [Emericellopsis atlantica]KAG9255530.1 hypothetical protein F5Z01DRAFT_651402 [Emericellopsis atlantica]
MFCKRPATRIAANTLQEAEMQMNRGTKHHLPPPSRLTGHQAFYIFAMAGVGGGCLSAGFNFAIAYAMYNTTKQPIQLFRLPNTLAGDAALSIIIQCILTWFVEWLLVANDLRRHSVQPIAFLEQPTSSSLRWLLFLERNPSTKLHNALQQALRGFLLCVPAFLVLWPVSVGILTMVGEKQGGDWVFERLWTPQVFKAILSGVLGLVTTPVMAMFWMVRAGWDGEKEADIVAKVEC